MNGSKTDNEGRRRKRTMQKMKVFRRLMVLLLIVCLLAGNAVQAVGMSQQNTAVSVQKEQTGSIDTAAAQKALTERREQAGLIRASADQLDPDQEIRVIVEMEAQPAVQSVVVQSTGAKLNAQLQSVETKALRAQQTVIHSAKAITGNDAIQQTAYLVNTFSMNMTPAEMAEVAELPGVKSVSPVTTFEMKMNYASHMTTVYKMWEEMGYTGEGTVIAVLDSGVNYHHPDMKLSDGAKIRITENAAKALIQKLGYGTYYSDKVPFAYSYSGYYEMDNHSNTHGLHVSGIAAGNGGDTGITGVAPNAQILGLQVFGMGNSAFTDDIIRAVEDAVKLGADIMNLSLGSTAGFYDDVAYLQSALQSATDDGVLCCVAAGNDGSSASLLGINTNDFGVVDSGAVSAPSTTPGVLSVASVNNTYLKGNTLSLTDAAGTTHEATVFNFSQLYNTVREETVVLLSKGEIDSKKVRVEFSLEDMDMSGFQKGATYEQIKAYVLEHTGLKVSSLYISQIKRKCGLDVGQNYNLSKKEDAKVPKCPPEKEAAIRDALKYFQMI